MVPKDSFTINTRLCPMRLKFSPGVTLPRNEWRVSECSLDLLDLLAGTEVGTLLPLVVGVDVDDSLFVL